MPQPQPQPQNLKHPRPPSGLTGWPAAWNVLDRIESDRQRDTLAWVVRGLGVQGPAALEHAARQCVWLCGLGGYAPPKRALTNGEVELVERRVREALSRVDAKQFPKLKKL
jgi:hypothetical protein